MDHDLVIRGGTIVDGSGGELRDGDVAVSGGRIVAIGAVAGRGREEIDARGAIVTPGFVDLHTHYDGQVTWEESMAPSSDHGVTTVVMGNCAVGLAPCRPEDRDRLIHVMAGVEDIPEAVMAEGLAWNWESFPDYLDVLATRRSDVDFAAQLAHAPLRVYVMGKRGADRELATIDDLARMQALVTEALLAGAVGVSTSRTVAHRSLDGQLAPAETCGGGELMAIARGVRAAGCGVIEAISDFYDVSEDGSEDFDLFRRMAELSGRPISYTVLQMHRNRDGWRRILDLTAEANARGVTMAAQIAPRPVGVHYGLDLSFNPFSFHPSYAAIAGKPLAERVAILRDPAFKARLLAEENVHANPFTLGMLKLYDHAFRLDPLPRYFPDPANRIDRLAAARGMSVAELAYDMLLEDEGRAMLHVPMTNFCIEDMAVTAEQLRDPNTLIGLGDGGAHYGLICDASYPSFVLDHWAKDPTGDGFDLAWAVNAMTHKPARWAGFDDRGLIAEGCKADLNIIDPTRLALHRPTVNYDLPGGARRLTQRADGYRATIVSGAITRRDGEATGAKPGRLVRGAQAARTSLAA